MILGSLDTPNICSERWYSRLIACVTFENHHTTPYAYDMNYTSSWPEYRLHYEIQYVPMVRSRRNAEAKGKAYRRLRSGLNCHFHDGI